MEAIEISFMLVDSLKAVMISRTVVENFEAVDFLEIEAIMSSSVIALEEMACIYAVRLLPVHRRAP